MESAAVVFALGSVVIAFDVHLLLGRLCDGFEGEVFALLQVLQLLHCVFSFRQGSPPLALIIHHGAYDCQDVEITKVCDSFLCKVAKRRF